jgi:hypothetical protein
MEVGPAGRVPWRPGGLASPGKQAASRHVAVSVIGSIRLVENLQERVLSQIGGRDQARARVANLVADRTLLVADERGSCREPLSRTGLRQQRDRRVSLSRTPQWRASNPRGVTRVRFGDALRAIDIRVLPLTGVTGCS